MPLIGWLFLLLAVGIILGNLLMLRHMARKPIDREKMDRIRKRKAELEAEEEADDQHK